MFVSNAIDLLFKKEWPWRLKDDPDHYTHLIVCCADGDYWLPLDPPVKYYDWHHEGGKDSARLDGTVLTHLMISKRKGTIKI
jgi:hypothetical protein